MKFLIVAFLIALVVLAIVYPISGIMSYLFFATE